MSGSIESETDGKDPDVALAAVGLDIRNLIYTVRGTQVMLDSDLARLYGVETKALNRAAKRNEGRFPEDFRFQLKRDEAENLRCQIGTLPRSGQWFKRWKNVFAPRLYRTGRGDAFRSIA